MGKCKKRTLNKQVLDKSMTRNEAIRTIIQKIQTNSLDTQAKNLLTLFGITAEELTEAGATFEEALILKRHM